MPVVRLAAINLTAPDWNDLSIEGAEVHSVTLVPSPTLSASIDRVVADLRGRVDVLMMPVALSRSLIEYVEPEILLIVEEAPIPDTSLEFPGMELVWNGSFSLESFGSPTIGRISISCFAASEGWDISPLKGLYGTEEEGRVQLWPTSGYEGAGVSVARDSSAVVNYLMQAHQGLVPLPVQPGFPFVLSARPFDFQDMGVTHSGVLCASVDNPGGYVVLGVPDILKLIGYPKDFFPKNFDDREAWTWLRHLIPVQVAESLVTWAVDTHSHREAGG